MEAVRALTKSEFMARVVNDLYEKKRTKKEYENYAAAKRSDCYYKDALHKKRQPHWKNK